MNGAFNDLRRLVPTYPPDKKLSKNEILRLAIKYIRLLSNVLNYQDQQGNQENEQQNMQRSDDSLSPTKSFQYFHPMSESPSVPSYPFGMMSTALASAKLAQSSSYRFFPTTVNAQHSSSHQPTSVNLSDRNIQVRRLSNGPLNEPSPNKKRKISTDLNNNLLMMPFKSDHSSSGRAFSLDSATEYNSDRYPESPDLSRSSSSSLDSSTMFYTDSDHESDR